MWLLQGLLSFLGRLLICAIFVMSVLGNKIPHFGQVVEAMQSEGIPRPTLMLVGAIVVMLSGSALIILGYGARWGAALLLIFLVLATYYFHDFWEYAPDTAEFAEQRIQFMKNLALMGVMLFIMANGAGAWSFHRAPGRRCRICIRTSARNAAVDDQGLAGDEAGGVGEQETNDPGDVGGLPSLPRGVRRMIWSFSRSSSSPVISVSR